MKKKISISITKEQRLWFTTIISSIHIKYIQKLPSHDRGRGNCRRSLPKDTKPVGRAAIPTESGHQISGLQIVVSGAEVLLLPGNLVEMQNQHHESAALEVELSTQYYSKLSR